jgi:hypothetical protein
MESAAEASVSEHDEDNQPSSPDYFDHGKTEQDVNAGQALFAALCSTRARVASSQGREVEKPTRSKSVEVLLQEAMVALGSRHSASSHGGGDQHERQAF